jgi:hypothetical protein
MIRRVVMDCAREDDVLEAVAFERWPDHAAELAAHVATCACCADLVEVVRALHDDCEAACRKAPVPPAEMVWWRATIRRRADAARTASRPITVAQGIAGACAVGLTGGLAGIAWRSVHWADRFGELATRLATRRVDLTSASTLAMEHALPLVLALAACLVLAPLALYLTLADD